MGYYIAFGSMILSGLLSAGFGKFAENRKWFEKRMMLTSLITVGIFLLILFGGMFAACYYDPQFWTQ